MKARKKNPDFMGLRSREGEDPRDLIQYLINSRRGGPDKHAQAAMDIVGKILGHGSNELILLYESLAPKYRVLAKLVNEDNWLSIAQNASVQSTDQGIINIINLGILADLPARFVYEAIGQRIGATPFLAFQANRMDSEGPNLDQDLLVADFYSDEQRIDGHFVVEEENKYLAPVIVRSISRYNYNLNTYSIMLQRIPITSQYIIRDIFVCCQNLEMNMMPLINSLTGMTPKSDYARSIVQEIIMNKDKNRGEYNPASICCPGFVDFENIKEFIKERVKNNKLDEILLLARYREKADDCKTLVMDVADKLCLDKKDMSSKKIFTFGSCLRTIRDISKDKALASNYIGSFLYEKYDDYVFTALDALSDITPDSISSEIKEKILEISRNTDFPDVIRRFATYNHNSITASHRGQNR